MGSSEKNKGYGKGDKVAAVRLKTSLPNPENLRKKRYEPP